MSLNIASIRAEPTSSRFTRWRPGLLVLAGLVIFTTGLYVLRAPILSTSAKWYIVNNSPAKADAIIVLGGGANFRSFEAVRLYHEGLAPRIVIMNSELHATDRDEVTIPEQELVHRILLRNGVPANAIEIAGTNLTSTFEEALATRQWCIASKAQVLLIPTGAFHTRRVRWVFHKILSKSGVRFRVLAIQDPRTSTWWQHEDTLLDFQNEVVKLAMYWCKY